MPDHEYGEIVVLQHHDAVDVARVAEVLVARSGRRPWRVVRSDQEALPATFAGVDGVIALGGPMGVYDRDALPWIDDVLELLRAAVAAEVPVFGICLGSQMLATALGGRVERRPLPQLGFLPLTRTADAQGDPVFAGWPDGSRTTFMHGDSAVALPDGAVEMLTGADGTSAWRAPTGLSYGVQFHPEADADVLARWSVTPLNRERFAKLELDPAAYVEEARRRQPFLLAVGLSLVGRWLDAVVGRDDPAPPRRARRAAPA